MSVTHEDICNVIVKILSQKNRIDLGLLVNDNFDVLLTGDLFRLNDIELTYLFLEAEKRFDIIIPFDMVQNYEFNSVNSIAKIIEALLKKAKPREGCCL